MATTEDESPLITALPPQTDYISYLTIIEHYLSEDTLPILHKVLQDEKLTTNIGWDLVHLLVRQNDITTDEARRDGVHGSDDFDFCILSIGIFNDGLHFADAAGFLELGVRDFELDLIVPIDELRHFCFCCRMESV